MLSTSDTSFSQKSNERPEESWGLERNKAVLWPLRRTRSQWLWVPFPKLSLTRCVALRNPLTGLSSSQWSHWEFSHRLQWMLDQAFRFLTALSLCPLQSRDNNILVSLGSKGTNSLMFIKLFQIYRWKALCKHKLFLVIIILMVFPIVSAHWSQEVPKILWESFFSGDQILFLTQRDMEIDKFRWH